MISVVIPTLDAAETLASTLAPLVPAAVQGVVREVVVADGGSSDETLAIADLAGCTIVQAQRGRGVQLAAGAQRARSDWLLFLHADTVLSGGWERQAARFVDRAERTMDGAAAASFTFALDDLSWQARLLERIVAGRVALLRLPYGDQGLLVSRRLYDALGGYRPLPLMEDVDFVRRIGRRRLHVLDARAVTSAVRYRRDGFVRRMARNGACVTLFAAGVPPRLIARLYG